MDQEIIANRKTANCHFCVLFTLAMATLKYNDFGILNGLLYISYPCYPYFQRRFNRSDTSEFDKLVASSKYTLYTLDVTDCKIVSHFSNTATI